MANNLVGSGTTTLSGEQLATLQTHMTNARVAMAEARARMERIAKDPDASALFAPDNELITRLRSELLDLSVRANDIESRVGKDHLAAVKVRNRMEEVREAIAAEQKRIAGSFGKNYELARAQYDELSAAMSRAMGEEGANSDAKARMRELESAAETLRGLYNQALQQFSQMNRVDAQPAYHAGRSCSHARKPPHADRVLEEAIADPGRRVGDRVAAGRRFRIGQELSVWRFQNRPASDSRDWAALRCPPGTLRCRRAGRLEDRRIRVELAVFAIFPDAAQYLGHDQYRTEGIRFEGRLRRLLKLPEKARRLSPSISRRISPCIRTTRVLVIDADFHRQSLTNRVAPDASVGFREALEEPTALAKFVVEEGASESGRSALPGFRAIDQRGGVAWYERRWNSSSRLHAKPTTW